MAKTRAASDEVVEENVTTPSAESESVSPADKPAVTEEVTSLDSAEVTIEEPEAEPEENDDCQMDVEIKGSTATVTMSWAEKSEEEPEAGEKTCADAQTSAKEINGDASGKRKAESTDDVPPPKKYKLINEGFCIFVGNLDSSKPLEEIKDSLAKYCMSQSLLVQDIRVDPSRVYAYVDLASQLDLTKALTLNRQALLDRPMKIKKAKVIKVWEKEKKVPRSPLEKRKEKDARCLYVNNLPFNMTKEDILKSFYKAVTVRFPGGLHVATKGIAFVEFPNRNIAETVMKVTNGTAVGGRNVNVRFVGQKDEAKGDGTKAAPAPCNTLFVGNLHFKADEKNIKKVFKRAVNVKLPQKDGKLKGYAFVEFPSVEEAEKALKGSQNATIFKRPLRVQFGEMKPQHKRPPEVLSTTTLIVRGLTPATTSDTLSSAFEGAVATRVILDKVTKVSKGYGFVEFDSDEACKAAMESVVDCEIDGSKVTASYAKVALESVQPTPTEVAEVTDSETSQPSGEEEEETGVTEKKKKKMKTMKMMNQKTEKELLSTTTLIVRGLAPATTPDTLSSAFEGAVAARVILDKVTRVSKGYGFVEFDSDEACKAAMELVVDCEIDGSKVTASYAKVVPESVQPTPTEVAEVTEVTESETAQPSGEEEEETVVTEKKKKKKTTKMMSQKMKKGRRSGAGKTPDGVKKRGK